jgi:hypothetical protein
MGIGLIVGNRNQDVRAGGGRKANRKEHDCGHDHQKPIQELH